MKKVGLFFAVLVFCFSSFALAQDPGIPDTAVVECLEIVRPNSQVVLNIYVVNDENLGAFTIPLTFPDTITELDIICDSISFVGTRAEGAGFKGDIIFCPECVENNKNRIKIFAVWLSGNLPPGNVSSGPAAKVYFATGPSWDSTRYVPVDSTTIPPNVGLEFSSAEGTAFLPKFAKGCLGKEPVTPGITVVSPNGGEKWSVGSVHNITWTSQDFTGNVKIEYSTNGGSSWTTIIASTPDDGNHPWTIPNTPTNQGRVRVSDAADGTPSDMSDNNFTINTAPVITVPGTKTVLCDSLSCDALSFEVYATDGDPLDILTITKYGVGDFHTVPHPSPDTGFFSWTPTPDDTLGSPYVDTFMVNDGTGLADTGLVTIWVKSRGAPPVGQEGDLNGDGKINATDVIYLVNFLFKSGPQPIPPPAGDINGDCFTTVEDLMHLINYLYRGGPPPKIRCNPGDADYNGYVNVQDVVYLVNYLFKYGEKPRSMKSCDVDADCDVDVGDLVYLINYMFRNGPALLPGCAE